MLFLRYVHSSHCFHLCFHLCYIHQSDKYGEACPFHLPNVNHFSLFFPLFSTIHHTGEHSPLFTIHHINSLFCFRCGLPPKFFIALSFYEVDICRSSFSSRTASSVFLRSSFAIFFSCLKTLCCNFE